MLFCEENDMDKFVGIWSCENNYLENNPNETQQYLAIGRVNDRYIIFFIDLNNQNNNYKMIGEYKVAENIIVFRDEFGTEGELSFSRNIYNRAELIYLIYELDYPEIIYLKIRSDDFSW